MWSGEGNGVLLKDRPNMTARISQVYTMSGPPGRTHAAHSHRRRKHTLTHSPVSGQCGVRPERIRGQCAPSPAVCQQAPTLPYPTLPTGRPARPWRPWRWPRTHEPSRWTSCVRADSPSVHPGSPLSALAGRGVRRHWPVRPGRRPGAGLRPLVAAVLGGASTAALAARTRARSWC